MTTKTDVTQNMKNSVLVSLQFTMWDSNVLDRDASDEMAKLKKVKTKSMCRVRKSLIPAHTALATIKEIHNEARKFLYNNTFAWKFKGPRILTVENYNYVVSKLREYEAAFNIAVPEFLTQAEEIAEEAKEQLGDLFNENDYPTVDYLKTRFAFNISVDALPIATDLLALGLSADEVEKITEYNKSSLHSVISDANNELWTRLKTKVEVFYENIVNPDSKVRAKTLEALVEVAELFPKINITNDDRLNSICDNILELLATESKESLEGNAVKRENISVKFKAIKELIEIVTLENLGIEAAPSEDTDLEESADDVAIDIAA